ncbi:hypothetical protein M0802_008611 [Mischocyttarus mexicanus]|nr:hypothetical protein M0802_008611 [Mischocyttarus mexicanus]
MIWLNCCSHVSALKAVKKRSERKGGEGWRPLLSPLPPSSSSPPSPPPPPPPPPPPSSSSSPPTTSTTTTTIVVVVKDGCYREWQCPLCPSSTHASQVVAIGLLILPGLSWGYPPICITPLGKGSLNN